MVEGCAHEGHIHNDRDPCNVYVHHFGGPIGLRDVNPGIRSSKEQYILIMYPNARPVAMLCLKLILEMAC